MAEEKEDPKKTKMGKIFLIVVAIVVGLFFIILIGWTWYLTAKGQPDVSDGWIPQRWQAQPQGWAQPQRGGYTLGYRNPQDL